MKIISVFSISSVLLLASHSGISESADVDELYRHIQALNERLRILEARLGEQSETTESVSIVSTYTTEKVSQKNSLRTYATIRPTIGYIDEFDQTLTDVRDALSHVGFKATREIMDGWTAEIQGEWGVDLSNNGDFGKARRAYVAVDSPLGRLGIGKQRPPQYLLIAEHVDIFNHASSPFAYDPESIFFVNNLLNYRFNTGPLTFMAASQFNGEAGDNHSDLTNAGLSYDFDGLHFAVTYLKEDATESDKVIGEDEVWAGALAYTFDNNLYMALAYQDREYDRELGVRDGHTWDVSMAYPMGQSYRLKLGYFDFDDGLSSQSSQAFDGFNATLEWMPKSKLRFHLEYLQRNFDEQFDFDSLSIGFRYDLSETWYY